VRIGLRIFRWNVDTAVRRGSLPDLGHHHLWLLDDLLRSVKKMGLPVESYPSVIRDFHDYEPVVVKANPKQTFGRMGFSEALYAKHTKRSGGEKVTFFQHRRHDIAAIADGQDAAAPADGEGRLQTRIDPLTDSASRRAVVQLPSLVASGNAAEIYRKTAIHTTKAYLIRLKDEILALKETWDLLKLRSHGELLRRLRNGKDCTDILATPELAGAIASPHREVNRAKAFIDGIFQQRPQRSPETVVVAPGPAAVVGGALLDPLRLQEEGQGGGGGGGGSDRGGSGGGGRGGGGAADAEEDEGQRGGGLDYDNNDDDLGGGDMDDNDTEESPAEAAVVQVGKKRRGAHKDETGQEKKDRLAVAARMRRDAKKDQLALLPSPVRAKAQDGERLKNNSRKRKERENKTAIEIDNGDGV
jgi:uncharacterized membrane protein YgcG